ncbi:MAG: hypothetical protein IANPNBLG_00773 [Bryobacteraceae bacterium]|nr:hypothetical protein [Bryobacteraceae bacterium]
MKNWSVATAHKITAKIEVHFRNRRVLSWSWNKAAAQKNAIPRTIHPRQARSVRPIIELVPNVICSSPQAGRVAMHITARPCRPVRCPIELNRNPAPYRRTAEPNNPDHHNFSIHVVAVTITASANSAPLHNVSRSGMNGCQSTLMVLQGQRESRHYLSIYLLTGC